MENYGSNSNNYSNTEFNTEEKKVKKELNIISNEFEPIKVQKIQEEKKLGTYVENLNKNKMDHKARKQLSFVSCLGNLDELDLNKICHTDVNVQEDLYANEQKKKIEENAKDKFKNKNSTKLKKFMDQSSTIFANELYTSNMNLEEKREVMKLQLVPKENKADRINLSNDEIKSAFAKKG